MKQKTELYSQPTCRVLVVRFEGSILSASEFRTGGVGTYGADEIFENDEY